MVSNLNEFKQQVKQWIKELIVASSVSREGFNRMIRDAVNEQPSLKDRADRIISFETTIDNMTELDEIKSFYEGVSDLVKVVQKQAWEDRKKQDQNFLEKYQKEYIEKVESKLRKTDGKVSEAALNEKLGASDWREEIKKKTDILSAQSKQFEIEDVIEKLNKEIVCDYCKETKVPYPASSYEIPSKKKKFCSLDCQDAWKKENNYTPTPNKKKGKWNFSITDLFGAMREAGIESINIDSATNEIVVKYKNNTTGKLEDSSLPRELKSQVKSEVETSRQPITYNQLNDEINSDNRNNRGNDNKGIIGFAIVIVLIVGIIIGAVIYRRRKRNY